MAKLSDIGTYKILGEIGDGAYATVYLAKSEKFGQVALKVLKPAVFHDSVQIGRFRQEARFITELDHSHIINTFETEETSEFAYIAMEHIAGGNLRQRLKAGPLTREEAVRIVTCIGAALTYVHNHQNQIVHRDLKPENILLDVTQKPARPILTDFGSIKQLLPTEELPTMTSTGGVIGTYHYMAPEQSNNDRLTPLVDLYALSIIFFEMLTGQYPFKGYSATELLQQQHLDQPIPLISSVIPTMEQLFDNIFVRAVAKDPADRFQSVAKFIEEVQAANVRAEQAEKERVKRHKEASAMVEVARTYWQRDSSNPDRALNMVEAALEIEVRHIDALRLKGEIYLAQQQFPEALTAYEQAYEQAGMPVSEAGLDYLKALNWVAETHWQNQNQVEAVEYCHRVVEIMGEDEGGDARFQTIREQVWPRLAEFHQQEGEKAYDQGNPQDIDKVIEMMAYHIGWLSRLNGDNEGLKYRRKNLEIKKHTDRIEAEEKTIKELLAKVGDASIKDEDIMRPYLTIDEHYQKLIELQPDHYEWKEKQQANLNERVKIRQWLAECAENESDYETALMHYRVILGLQQTEGQQNLTAMLNYDLEQKIMELEKKADYATKYREIEKLIDKQEYQRALEHLDLEFIQKGDYRHRDVARLLWGLVHANRHDGEFPEEWDFAHVKQKLTDAREETVILKETLETVQNELNEMKQEMANIQAGRDTAQNELDKIRRTLQKIKINFVWGILPAVFIGVVMGIIMGMKFPAVQNRLVLVVVTVIAILSLVGFRRITKRADT